MAKKTKQLEQLWWDWLSTAERLLRSLHEQTAALTLRQPERVEKIQPELDSLMTKMEETDLKAVACVKELAEELGTEPSLRSIAQALEKAEAQQIQSVANRVIVVGRNVQTVIAKNRALIENELEYVNGTMALVARTATEQQGPYQQAVVAPSVVMNQVA
ncbi:MAG: flagellar export chaperone FlgN [Armatimonadetes bacterium]|nr:flagellar export chaperone FlgN [Armatimonadota bacterium]